MQEVVFASSLTMLMSGTVLELVGLQSFLQKKQFSKDLSHE